MSGGDQQWGSVGEGSLRTLLIGGGVVAGVAALWSTSKQGSWAVSTLQRSLLTGYRQYKDRPEVFVRLSDFAVAVLTDNSGLPGVNLTRQELLNDITYAAIKGHTAWLREGDEVSLRDYARLLRDMVANNDYYVESDLSTAPPYFGALTAWIAPQIGRLLRDAERGRLKVSQKARKEYREGARFPRDDAELVAQYPSSPEEAQVILTLKDWVSGLGPVGDWLDAVRARDPLANSIPYEQKSGGKITTPAILKPGVPNLHGDRKKGLRALGIDEAKVASRLFHFELAKQGLAAHVIPATLAHKIPGGWRVEILQTRPHVQSEGNALIHCIGRSPSYWRSVESGTHEIYSLRTPDGTPQQTVYVQVRDRDGTRVNRILQSKGVDNRLPGMRKHIVLREEGPPRAIIHQWWAEPLPEECTQMRAFIKWLEQATNAPVEIQTSDLRPCREVWAEEDRAKAQAQAQARGQRPRPRGRGRRQEEEG
ncbi:hypothetical protein CMI47_19555 [Candidatus Pacearchaeota archaeon]|nr:hypothetical protein [Candidatus Pacearchaeota archaeon]